MSNYHDRGSRRAMRTVLGLFAGLVLLGTVLASCSTHTTNATSARPKMNYATAELAGNAFISKYEWKHGVIEDETLENFLIHEATLVCTRLGNGYTISNIWDVGVRDGMSSDQSATVIDLAIEVYCPQYSDRLEISAKLPTR